MVLEYADGGDMYDYVVSRKRLSENKVGAVLYAHTIPMCVHAVLHPLCVCTYTQARWIFQQLIIAVDYMHKMVREYSQGCTPGHVCAHPHYIHNPKNTHPLASSTHIPDRVLHVATSNWKTHYWQGHQRSHLSSCVTWGMPRYE